MVEHYILRGILRAVESDSRSSTNIYDAPWKICLVSSKNAVVTLLSRFYYYGSVRKLDILGENALKKWMLGARVGHWCHIVVRITLKTLGAAEGELRSEGYDS